MSGCTWGPESRLSIYLGPARFSAPLLCSELDPRWAGTEHLTSHQSLLPEYYPASWGQKPPRGLQELKAEAQEEGRDGLRASYFLF